MSAAGTQLQSGEALALHLRQHPEAALQPPRELAKQFGLNPDFVADVLSGLGGIGGRTQDERRLDSAALAKRWFHRARLIFRVLTNRPILFVFVTLVAAIIVSALIASFGDSGYAIVAFGKPLLWQATTLIVVGALHLACFYRHAMARYALYGGLVCWLTIAPVNMIVRWTEIRSYPADFVTANLLIVACQSLVLASQYTLMALGAAVLGGLVWFRRRENELANLSRQQMLERLFEIQERLKGIEPSQEDADSLWKQRLKQGFQKYWPFWCALLGVSFSTLYMVVLFWFGGPAPVDPKSIPMLAIGMAVFFLLELVMLCGIGFLSKGLGRAFIGAWIYQAASLVPMMLPIPGFGTNWVIAHYAKPTPIISLTLFTSAIAVISALGARVDEKVNRERKLGRNEPAALLAEMVRIQWALAPTPTEVCIMVVDAVRSAEMKAQADPLNVEYSFREYQNLIRAISEDNGGHVHSTAGDGAVVAFPDAASAFIAAKRIRTEIDGFNKAVNRLDVPFRLRIGLHKGSVAGKLEQVQFTDVIDIAAHVQMAAPVGGITVTEHVASKLPEERFAPMQDPVDGQKVFLALDPTVDL